MTHIYKRYFLYAILSTIVGLSMLSAQDRDEKKLRRAERKAERVERRLAKDRYLVFEYGFLYAKMRDTKMEQSTFDGPGARIHIGYLSRTEKGVHDFDMAGGQFGWLSASHGESNLINGRGDINYTYLRNINDSEGKRVLWRVGGAFTGVYNFKYVEELVNSSVNWEGVASIGPSSEWEGEVGFLKGGIWQYRITVPLVSYVNRFPEFGLLSGEMKHVFAPIGKFSRVLSEIGISKTMGRESDNLIRLSYTWDYYAFNESDFFEVRNATHQVLFSIYIKL